MQLKKKKVHESIRGALALATCSLMSSVSTQAADDPGTGGWDVESALLYYSEKDRVSVIEPVFSARKETGDDEYLTVHGVLDSMTGASPNGATITNKPQTFTTASGSANKTTVPANELPKAPFNDFRISLGLDWAQPVTRTSRNTMGASLSVESDYTSLGGSYTHLWDFNNRLTTLTAGLGLSFDSVSPKGGAPTPLQRLSTITAAPVATVTAASGGGEDGEGIGFEGKTKFIADMVLGVTQVLSPRALMQLNYSHGYHNGYMTDPYKLVSMIDVTGATADYIFESRPGIRNSNSIYWKWVYHLPEDVIHLSHRYFWDNWGIVSNTTELNYRFEITHGLFIAPYGRYYTQTAADFYHHSLSNTAAIPANVSADYRLAEMKSKTTGLKLGLAEGENSEWSLTVERMVQTGNSHPADAIGIQNNFDLYPKLEANIIQLNYFAKF